jgi:hypothetical protein
LLLLVFGLQHWCLDDFQRLPPFDDMYSVVCNQHGIVTEYWGQKYNRAWLQTPLASSIVSCDLKDLTGPLQVICFLVKSNEAEISGLRRKWKYCISD